MPGGLDNPEFDDPETDINFGLFIAVEINLYGRTRNENVGEGERTARGLIYGNWKLDRMRCRVGSLILFNTHSTLNPGRIPDRRIAKNERSLPLRYGTWYR